MATYEKKRVSKSGMTRMNSGKNVAQAKVTRPASATNSRVSASKSVAPKQAMNRSAVSRPKTATSLPYTGGRATASKLPGSANKSGISRLKKKVY